MVAKKILFPTDFSSTSEACLEHATTMARDTGATLLILHVEEPPAAYAGGEMYYGMLETDDREVRQMLESVKPSDPSVSYEHLLVRGDPAHEIVSVADREHVDLIVLGTHGRSGLRRLLMGSVAESVVRHANCPVLTFKQLHAPAHA